MDDKIRVAIGQRLIHIRGRKSRAAFAQEIGVHKNTLGNYERGERVPDADILSKLMDRGFNANWVISGEGPIELAELGISQPGTATHGHLDEDLFRVVIEAVEEALDMLELEIEPATKKADLILAIYEMYNDTGAQPDAKKVIRLIKTAA